MKLSYFKDFENELLEVVVEEKENYNEIIDVIKHPLNYVPDLSKAIYIKKD